MEFQAPGSKHSKVQNLPVRRQSPHLGGQPAKRGHTVLSLPRLNSTAGLPDSDDCACARPRATDWSESCNEETVAYVSTGGTTMHEEHRKAAEQHELAAQAHRTAAEHNEKGDNSAATWHSERALEYSDHAYKLAREAHSKSGEIVSL